MEIKTKSDIESFINGIKIGETIKCNKREMKFLNEQIKDISIFVKRNKEEFWTINLAFCNRPSLRNI